MKMKTQTTILFEIVKDAIRAKFIAMSAYIKK
jgi:hypothetical protein